MLVSTGVTLSMPLLVQNAVKHVERSRDGSALNAEVLVLLCVLLIGSVFSYMQFLLSAYAGNRVIQDLRQKLFSHITHLPVSFFDRTRSGDLTSRLSNDVSQLQATLTDDLVRFPGQVIVLMGGVVTALYLEWKLTIIVVGTLIAMMTFFVVTGRSLRLLNRETLDAVAQTMGGITEVITNIRLVKAFAREDHEEKRTYAGLGKILGLSMRGAKLEGLMGTVGGASFMLMLVGLVWYGGHGFLTGTLSLSSVAGFLMAILVIAGPMGQIASLYTRLQRSVGASERLFLILDEPTEVPDKDDSVAFPNGLGTVQFQGVQFAYRPDVPVIRDLNLNLKSGTVTALVGASGAGKSTVASLLFRFYEPSEGVISIDGVDIRQIQRSQLRAHIGLVPQDPILFEGSILINIRYGRLDATDEEVKAAAALARVDEFVNNFPEGYQTIVGERGITLSGGQRQRVAIARVFLKNPQILVLDEATSALDTRSEALVKDALEQLMKGRTTLVIAHRLTTIRNADQIVVLSEGKVGEMGSHDQLMQLNGKYARLQEFAEIS